MPELSGKFGTMVGDLTPVKDRVDFFLTRYPDLYLAIEERREWVNWDKRVYLSFIRRGDVVVDVGANVGAHTVFFSHLVGERGRVLAFEPLPGNLEAMRDLLRRRQRFANTTIVASAVGNPGDGVDKTDLLIPGADLTQASLKRQNAGSWAAESTLTKVSCAFTSLDRSSAISHLGRLDFLKIDVEGGELDVLKGGARTIARHHPVIYCEAFEKWTRSFGYGPPDLFVFVKSLGYTGARVITRGEVHVLDLAAPPPPEWFTLSSDVLFLPPGKEALTRKFDRRYLGDE